MSIIYPSNSENKTSLDCALAYAQQGWHVFPIHSVDLSDGQCTCGRPDCTGNDIAKHPVNIDGSKGATLDPELLKAWHQETQGICNWAVATGERSHLLVIDADDLAGFIQLEQQHTPLPLTPAVQTGREPDGRHYYFQYPAGSGITIGAGKEYGLPFDWRGNGGYVIVPPSLQRLGKRYAWLTPMTTPLAVAPAWLVVMIQQCKAHARGEAAGMDNGIGKGQPGTAVRSNGLMLTVSPPTPDLRNSPGVGDGSRNAQLCRLVGVHLARGDDEAEIEALALAWAQRCDPPMPESRVRDTLRRLRHKHQAAASTETHTPPSQTADESLPQTADRKPLTTPGTAENGLRSADCEAANGGVVSGGVVSSVSVDAWPTLNADALHGLTGEMVKAIAPETEADPAGILLTLLVGFGNAIGRSPHFKVGVDRHGTNLFTLLVGDTAARKGMAWGIAKSVLERADPDWTKHCLTSGLGSGEGLVERVQDAVFQSEGDNIVVQQASAQDKRLLAVEEEYAAPLRRMKREDSTLSPLIRCAWDGKTLEVLNRKKNWLRASEAHVSIIGMITPDELAHVLKNSAEAVNGFSNRYLFCMVRRQQLLPHGGKADVLVPFADPLGKVLTKAKGVGEMKRTPEADVLWADQYAGLSTSKPGSYGKAVERACPQVMRLAMIYALLDGTTVIAVAHLRAALAVWSYCDASASYIFNRTLSASSTDDSLAVQLLKIIQTQPGIGLTGLHEATGKKHSAAARDTALAWLLANGLAHPEPCPLPQGGPPAQCWFPGPGSNPPHTAARNPQTVSGELEPPAEYGVRAAECGEQMPAVGHDPQTDVPALCSEPATECGVRSAEPLSLPELFTQVRACGGRLVWSDAAVVCEGTEPVPDAITQAVAHHQAELTLLVEKPRQQQEAKAATIFDPEAFTQAVYVKGGKVEKDEAGRCTLQLPQPDAELEAAFAAQYEAICAEYMTDTEFLAALDSARIVDD